MEGVGGFLPPENALTSGSISWTPDHPLAKERQVAFGPVWISPRVRWRRARKQCLSPLSHFSPPSYYFKKQRALRLSLCARNRARQGRPARAHTGLTFFCQAARLNGLSSAQLARSLHTMCRAGAPQAGPRAGGGGVPDTGRNPTGRGMLRVIRNPGHRHLLLPRGPSQYCPRLFLPWDPAPGGRSPYTQIPNLAGRPRPERKARVPGSDVRLPKPQQPGRPKLPPNLGPLSKGENPQTLLRTGQMGRRRISRWDVIVRQQRLGLEWDLSQKKWGAQEVHSGVADRAGRP